MKLKPGVDIRGIKPEIIVGMMVCNSIVPGQAEFVVTAGLDGKHMAGSKHYEGQAIDIRTRDMKPEMIHPMIQELKEALGYQFDVVLEGDHVHLEFDPKEK